MGSGGEFALVVLKNFFLTLFTLGIYAAWAKTNRRRFLWQNTDFHSQRFAYTGEGIELFKGYSKVIGVYVGVVIFFAVLNSLFPRSVVQIAQAVVGFLIAIVIPYAIYSSRAYLLSRTRWRGIQLGLDGPGRWPYTKQFLWGTFLMIATLGFFGPIRGNRLYSIMMNHARVGTLKFSYNGSEREAFKIFLRALIPMILTLGIYYFWYRAEVSRFRAAHTRLDGASASLKLQGGELIGLYLLNTLAILISFGLAFPWVVTRNLQFFMDRLRFEGSIDFASVEQKAGREGALGDTVADVLDVDFGL